MITEETKQITVGRFAEELKVLADRFVAEQEIRGEMRSTDWILLYMEFLSAEWFWGQKETHNTKTP